MALELRNGATDVDASKVGTKSTLFVDVAAVKEAKRSSKVIESLHFIPYYFRANRGGRGHMRVGLRAWEDRSP